MPEHPVGGQHVVLDEQGRVAARVLGKADKSTLDALIKDTVAESA